MHKLASFYVAKRPLRFL